MDQLASRVALARLLGRTTKVDEADLRDHYVRLYDDTGARTFDLSAFGGQVVGRVSVAKRKDRETVEPDDDDALLEWLGDPDNLEMVECFCYEHLTDFYKFVLDKTGECLPGVAIRRVPGSRYATINVEPKMALPVIEAALPGTKRLFELPGTKDE